MKVAVIFMCVALANATQQAAQTAQMDGRQGGLPLDPRNRGAHFFRTDRNANGGATGVELRSCPEPTHV
jgi:hypothetical protein